MRRRKYLSAHGSAMEGLHPFVWAWSLVAHDQKKKKGFGSLWGKEDTHFLLIYIGNCSFR